MEQKKEVQEAVVETGEYKMVAEVSPDFKITHLILNAGNGSQRVWRIKEMSDKEISFVIEKFN